ncbi:MAG: O-methyltransferase family 3 [Conexibacter sp.]|nr:O-methyltransferase family 3 [Conexibacter sp.]
MPARLHLRLLLRLAVAAPALPARVTWFHARALCVAISRHDHFTLRSMAAPHQLVVLVRLARGRRRVVELGTATGWTAAALALADPRRTVITCDPNVQPGRDRYLRLLSPATCARIALLRTTGLAAATLDAQPVDVLFVDASHERQATVDEWRAWRPRLAPGGIVIFHDYDHPDFPGVAQAVAELGLTGEQRAGMFVWRAPR